MPDSGLNSDLSAILWTAGAAAREPRPEERERRRAPNRPKHHLSGSQPGIDEPYAPEDSEESASDPERVSKKLDSFA